MANMSQFGDSKYGYWPRGAGIQQADIFVHRYMLHYVLQYNYRVLPKARSCLYGNALQRHLKTKMAKWQYMPVSAVPDCLRKPSSGSQKKEEETKHYQFVLLVKGLE